MISVLEIALHLDFSVIGENREHEGDRNLEEQVFIEKCLICGLPHEHDEVVYVVELHVYQVRPGGIIGSGDPRQGVREGGAARGSREPELG